MSLTLASTEANDSTFDRCLAHASVHRASSRARGATNSRAVTSKSPVGCTVLCLSYAGRSACLTRRRGSGMLRGSWFACHLVVDGVGLTG